LLTCLLALILFAVKCSFHSSYRTQLLILLRLLEKLRQELKLALFEFVSYKTVFYFAEFIAFSA
jgi:hypothetical protein